MTHLHSEPKPKPSEVASPDAADLSIDEMVEVAQLVSSEFQGTAEVRVASTESGRVEFLVTRTDCDEPPCVVMVNVTRARADFEVAFRNALAEAITAR